LATYEPDVLAEDLEVVFCGINPATTAAAAGHNFSNGSNRFWTALHLAGFTDRRLQPHEERRLLAYGLDRMGDQLSAAVRVAPAQRRLCAIPAEGAFEAADHGIGGLGRPVLVAALAIRSELQHLGLS
jgi:hypothetical protein